MCLFSGPVSPKPTSCDSPCPMKELTALPYPTQQRPRKRKKGKMMIERERGAKKGRERERRGNLVQWLKGGGRPSAET